MLSERILVLATAVRDTAFWIAVLMWRGGTGVGLGGGKGLKPTVSPGICIVGLGV